MSDPILRPFSSRNVSMATQLAHFTPENLMVATGLGEVVVEPSTELARGNTDFVLDTKTDKQCRSWAADILSSRTRCHSARRSTARWRSA